MIKWEKSLCSINKKYHATKNTPIPYQNTHTVQSEKGASIQVRMKYPTHNYVHKYQLEHKIEKEIRILIIWSKLLP